MKYRFTKVRVLLCMLLIFSIVAPCSIAQAATASTGIVIGEEKDTSTAQQQITYQELANQLGYFYTENVGIHGMQVAIMDHDKITFSNTYGFNSKKANTKPTKDTMYGVGSVSKIYTTAAVMHLVEQGKVDLDKPVVDYVKDFTMKDSRYTKITVRMLLNHSSGLYGSYMSNGMTINDASTLHHDQFLKVLSMQYLQYEPGTLSVYNNDGFELAEVLVERVSNTTFTKYLEDEILKPLGLTQTKTPQSKFNRKNLAAIYSDQKDEYRYEAVNTIGAGGIYATAEDICRFGSIFTTNNSNPVLSDTSRKAMTNKEYAKGFWLSKETDSIAYGLGWDSVHYSDFNDYGITACQKGGDTIFYHCSMTVLPDKGITIAVLSSGGSSSNLALYSNKIMLQYLSDKGELGTAKATAATTYDKTDLPANIEDMCGSYISTIGPVVTVSKKDNAVNINLYEKNYKFEYTKQGVFISDDYPGASVDFITHNGDIYIEWFEVIDATPLGKVDSSCILGQKLVKNPISEKVKKAWNNRSKKKYLLIDSLPSTYEYATGMESILLKLNYSQLNDGYIANMKIIDENLAYSQITVPMMYGRNGNQVKFYKSKGVEYCIANGYSFICANSIKNLPNKKSMKVTVPKTGYCQYYNIGSKMAEKKVTIKVPKNCSFVVYDKNGNNITNYYLDKKNTVKLPKGGLIAFVGSKNAKFTITAKK